MQRHTMGRLGWRSEAAVFGLTEEWAQINGNEDVGDKGTGGGDGSGMLHCHLLSYEAAQAL